MAIVAIPEKKTKVAIDYILAATLKQGGMSYTDIAKRLGCSPGSLKCGFSRKGYNQRLAVHKEALVKATEQSAIQAIQAVSERVKGTIGGKIERLANKLSEMPEKQRISDLKAQSEVLESLTRASKPVFGWGDESISGIVAIGVIPGLAGDPVIDVESVPLGNPSLPGPAETPVDNQGDSKPAD